MSTDKDRRMGDLDAENIMCRRVNQALRDQIQGLFVDRDALEEEVTVLNSRLNAAVSKADRNGEWG